MKLSALPADVWLDIPLGRSDMAALALTCRDLRAAMIAVACARGMRVQQPDVAHVMTPRWHALSDLVVRGLKRRYSVRAELVPPMPPLLVLPMLRSLSLDHCHLPSDRPFWPATLECCPRLASVKIDGDFFRSNYAADLNHAVDLLVHGAPRLQRLEMTSNWMVIQPRGHRGRAVRLSDEATLRAIDRACSLPPVASATLRHYRSSLKQAAFAVDAPLVSLDIEEPYEPPFVVSRLGEVTLGSVERLVWRQSWPNFDGHLLSGFQRLADLELHIDLASSDKYINKCIDSLRGLPRRLRRLVLRMDMLSLGLQGTDFAWGCPLQHLDALRELDIRMLFPPSSLPQLLGGWMGAGASVREVRVAFDEPVSSAYESAIAQLLEEEEADPEDDTVLELREAWEDAAQGVGGDSLSLWLDRHPAARATVCGLRDRFACGHPSATVLP